MEQFFFQMVNVPVRRLFFMVLSIFVAKRGDNVHLNS